jgi:putative salt-induced outer membrane protein
MPFQFKKISMILLGFSLSTASFATEGMVKVTKDKDYNLDADLSYLVNTTQNSGTESETKQSFAGNIDYRQMVGNWGAQFKASAVNSSDNNPDSTNVEQYLAFGKLTHSEGNFYEFGKLQWEKDLSSAFDYQTSLTAGLGKELYRDDIQFLTSEIGAGVRYDVERLPPQNTTTKAIGTLSAHYERQLLPTTKFIQDLGFDYGSNSNTLRAHSALSVKMTYELSGLVSFDYKKINADEGNSRSTLTSVGLKYSY